MSKDNRYWYLADENVYGADISGIRRPDETWLVNVRHG
jgi:hypothetical protein